MFSLLIWCQYLRNRCFVKVTISINNIRESKKSEGRGFKSTPEIIPHCFRVIIFDCNPFIASFSCEASEVLSKYFSVCNRRLEVRYLSLPAILIEFHMWKSKIKSNIIVIGMIVGMVLVCTLFMLPLHESLAGPH